MASDYSWLPRPAMPQIPPHMATSSQAPDAPSAKKTPPTASPRAPRRGPHKRGRPLGARRQSPLFALAWQVVSWAHPSFSIERDVPFRPQLLSIRIGVLEAARLHQPIDFLGRPHPFQRNPFDFGPAVLDDEFGSMVPDPRDLAAVRLGAVLPFYPPVRDGDAIPPSGVAGLDLAGAAAREESVALRDKERDQREPSPRRHRLAPALRSHV